MLILFNTLTRKPEDFHPIRKDQVGVYSCGPTVYWFAHIGNMRAFLFADLLCRTLRFNGFKVKQVMNITDVGHLTDDADLGEDKMIVAMQREGKTAEDIAEFYANAFFQDVKKVNIISADVYPRATQHIKEQIEMIVELEKNGFTYQTADGIYFDTAKLKEYGRLSGQNANEKKAGARVEMGEKKNVTDFALWKLTVQLNSHPERSPKDEVEGSRAKRLQEWESPWGVGFPGWHIECSAMSKKYLGIPFDIHTGGIDHIAVHHENEIVQTFGAEGKLEANVWMHNEFITVDGGKMSKSLGNFWTIRDLIEKGYDPLAFRYLCLQAHYRTKMNFTFAALTAAQNALDRLRGIVREWDSPRITPSLDKGGIWEGSKFEQRFTEAINDDLNTPVVLAIVWELIGSDYPSSAKAETLLKFDSVLGLRLDEYVAHPLEIPDAIRELVEQRKIARENNNWKESDRLRDEIVAQGYTVEDTDEGQRIRTI